jgi:hypothetical protein
MIVIASRHNSEGRRMPGVPYLVHFPDETTEVHEVRLPFVASPGTLLLPGWVVERVEATKMPFQGTRDNPEFEVWVAEAPSDFEAHSVETFDHPPLPAEALLDAALPPKGRPHSKRRRRTQ